jgi:pimeloyl-ACP methyl ester carboxylesterase
MKKFLKVIGIILIAILVLIVVAPLIVPIAELDTKPAFELADSDSQFINIGDLNVHYKQAGTGGPAIILLHGFGASEFSWREVLEPLSSLGSVYAYDRPGFGLTERPLAGDWSGKNPYGTSGQVQMLLDFMNEKGIEEAVLVGNSAGGTVATLFAMEHPGRVNGLILLDSAWKDSGQGMLAAWQKLVLDTPQAARLGPLLMRSIRKWGTELISTAWHDPEKIPAGVVEGYQKPLQSDNWDKALFEILKAREPLNLESRLNDLEIPVLVVSGDDDRIIPTEDSIQLASLIPGSTLAILPACGHVPQEECPEEFLKVVEPFIQNLQGEQ